VLWDEECPPQLATSKDCREGIRNPSQARNSVLLEWRNKPLPTRGLSPLEGPDNNDSGRIANERFIENLVRPNSALDVPSSQAGLIVPVEMKPSFTSEQVGPSYPTCPHDYPEMIRNDTVCSVAIEPHVSLGPGPEVPDAQDVCYDDVQVEESIQSSTTNTSCECEVIHRTDDSQVCLAMPPANKPKSVESKHKDVRLDSKSLVIEQGLDVHDVTRKGKQSRPPDVDPSTTKNSDPCYSKVSSSLVHSDARVTIEPGNPGLKSEDGICAGKRGRPPDIEQVLLRNNKCHYSGILKGNVRRTEYGMHTILKVENSTRKLNCTCKRDLVHKLHEKWKSYVPSTNVVAKRAHAEMLGHWYDNLEVYNTSKIVHSVDRYNIKALRDSPHQDKAILMGSLVCFARL
jgi:hypothetical protein